MATALKDVSVHLSDPSLLREQCYVDGAWVDADGRATIEVRDPASNDVIGTVPKMGVAETRRAIEAASRAFESWRRTTAKQRAAILRKWFDLMMANQEDLAVIMTREQGKPLAESRGEVAYGAAFVEWYAEEGKRVYGDIIPTIADSRRLMVIKQPVGVCAAITPWNFPNAMITRKCAPALAAGCTVVVKPASFTPYSALALAELAERAGMPKGVFNVVTGDARTVGGELTANDAVRKLSFTGSTEVGKILLKQCADTVKKVSMELGGHAPLIIFDDADIDAAVKGAMACKFRNSGQTCVCTNRIYVQDGVYDAFAAKFTEAVKALKVGPGHEPGVEQGPLIEPAAVDKVERHVEDATEQGRQGAGGRQAACPRRPVLRADRALGVHARDGDHQRGDLRPGGAALPVQGRGRGDRARQQDRVRPRQLLLRARRRPGVPGRRGAGGRHRQRQRGHLLDRGGAVRRLQALRHRPRGLEVRHRRVSRDQIRQSRRHPVDLATPR